MIRTPSLAEIYAAETRVSQAQQNTRASISKVQVLAHAGIRKIYSVAIVAGTIAAGLIWLVHKSSVVSKVNSARVATTTSAVGLALAFVLRYGKIALPFIIHQYQLMQARARLADSRSIHNSRTKLLTDSSDLLH